MFERCPTEGPWIAMEYNCEGAARLPLVADDLVLNLRSPEAWQRKLDFYTEALQVPVKAPT